MIARILVAIVRRPRGRRLEGRSILAEFLAAHTAGCGGTVDQPCAGVEGRREAI